MNRAIAIVLLAAGCGTGKPAPAPAPAPGPGPETASETATATETKTAPEPEVFELDQRFEAALLAAAAEYPKWGYVNQRPNLAPMLCRMPTARDYGMPARARMSEGGPHGKKLYYLAAKEKSEYLATRAPVGQVIVKEAWSAESEAGTAGEPNEPEPPDVLVIEPQRIRKARVGDGWMHTGDKAGLYIMIKMADDTEGTDAGWVYGTVTADGAKVTSAGRVAQCMGCHQRAPHGRLFGLKDGGAISDQEIIDDRKARGVGTSY